MHHSLAPTGSVGDSILLIVTLCFHSLFEGIAIGVAKAKDDAWKALWTISLHKIFVTIYCHGRCSPSYDSKPSLLIMCSLCFCICHFKSNWGGHWNHNRCHNLRCCGRLDLFIIDSISDHTLLILMFNSRFFFISKSRKSLINGESLSSKILCNYYAYSSLKASQVCYKSNWMIKLKHERKGYKL